MIIWHFNIRYRPYLCIDRNYKAFFSFSNNRIFHGYLEKRKLSKVYMLVNFYRKKIEKIALVKKMIM